MKGDPGYLSKDFERYQKVTPEDVQRVAKKYLGPGRIVLEVLPGTEVKITPDPRVPAEEAREKLAKDIEETTPLPGSEGGRRGRRPQRRCPSPAPRRNSPCRPSSGRNFPTASNCSSSKSTNCRSWR